jgi:hypothetical protein
MELFVDGPMKSLDDARKMAVPQITRMLSDADPFVRMTAANALKQIDPNAASKTGVK